MPSRPMLDIRELREDLVDSAAMRSETVIVAMALLLNQPVRHNVWEQQPVPVVQCPFTRFAGTPCASLSPANWYSVSTHP